MISTYITLAYMRSPESGKFAVWRACHAVLNATGNTGLTTNEVEEQIRLNFPDEEWQKGTMCSALSYSDDFKQDKRGGKWFLTGTTRGVEKWTAKRVRKAAEAAQGSSSNLIPPPTIPPPTSKKTRSGKRKRTAGHHPSGQPLAANAGPTVDLDHNSGFNHDSQSNSASRPKIKSTAPPPLPIFAEPRPIVGGLQGLLSNVPENPPQNIPALYDVPPNRPSNLPYPINFASAHDRHLPPPPLPPFTPQTFPHSGVGGASKFIPSSTRRQTRSQTRKRAAGYHPYEQSLAANAGPTVNLDHRSRANDDSQSNSASRSKIKNTTAPPLPIFAEPKPVVGGLQGLLANVPENPPQNIPALYDALPTRPSAPPPIDASVVPWTQRYYSDGINPSDLHVAYPGNLEAGAVDSQDVAGASRVNQPNNSGTIWTPNHGHQDLHSLPYGNTIAPATLPAGDHTMASPGYSAVTPTTVPQDFWAYNAPVPHNPDSSFVPSTQHPPYSEGITPSALDFAYPGNLEVGAADSQGVAGPSRVNQQHPLQDNPNNAGTTWMPNHGHQDLNSLPYGNTIAPATLPAADHTMAFPGYSAVDTTTVPQDFWAYDAPVSQNPVHYAPPTTWDPSQPCPDPEIAPAESTLDIEFGDWICSSRFETPS